MDNLYVYRARLMEPENGKHPVYDGDTMKVFVDLGFGIGFALGPVRLYGINTPEVRGSEKEEGLRVRDFVRELLDRPENKEFTVETYKDKKGKYGRYLATILLDDGTNLNQLLVEKGMAEVNFY